jgi:hypothetical protein
MPDGDHLSGKSATPPGPPPSVHRVGQPLGHGDHGTAPGNRCCTGAAAILSDYLTVSRGWLKAGRAFQTANLLGACAFVINGSFHQAWPSVATSAPGSSLPQPHCSTCGGTSGVSGADPGHFCGQVDWGCLVSWTCSVMWPKRKCGHCPHFSPRTGPYIGRIGSDSVCFWTSQYLQGPEGGSSPTSDTAYPLVRAVFALTCGH